ncbi:peptidase M23 [Paenibacillus sp. J31TS4]|uniref:LysM peptidoglycan-binding domain-containing protein n=1 Tax=Paenibacillus sp. J31TS4 TaxID=2807195 RepID=UPI001B2D98E5|nr:LysM peptidoglycan-binding domain-containing protein [Paenibacillus sp. J31TS4]GIP37193.1 peptidase M23 [Paenibacillus sp. J31TS4]
MTLSLKKASVLLSLSAVLGAGIAVPSASAAAATYEIKQDDTFWKVAQAKQIPLDLLLSLNHGTDPMNLQPGQAIRLPETYTVKDGETFWTISRSKNLPLDQLVAANPGRDPLNLYAGLTINLPTGVKAVSTAPAKPAAAAGNIVKTASGESHSFSKALNITATAYSSAPEENGGWGPVDYFGNPLKLGTIAVDPSVIPMNATVYITGYSNPNLPKGGMIAKATDQGGAIKGNRIDIFMPGSPQTVSDFGIQNVKVYILDK